jgi:hypothetical protein
MSDRDALTLDNASQAPDSQNTQETYKRTFTLVNHKLAGTRDLQYADQAVYDQRPAIAHYRCDRELQRMLNKDGYSSRWRTPKQAEQDGDDVYTLLNMQLAEVKGVRKNMTREEFEAIKTDRPDKWGQMCCILDGVMTRKRIFPEPQQTQQSVPKTAPYDDYTDTLGHAARTNATQYLEQSINGAQGSIADTTLPSNSAANTLAPQISPNTNINSYQGSIGPSENYADNSATADSAATATSAFNHPT